mgnify:CR=1 FL=1|jgi:threonine dehydratase
MITLSDIREAREAISGRIHRTPLLSFRALGRQAGFDCHIKAEQLQKTGSFKVRGALNKVRRLTAAEKARGLIAVSAGNHAQGVAYAAAAEGAACTVVMPEAAPRSKVEASRGYGARIVQRGTLSDAFVLGEELCREHGYTFVHPYDDPDVIAGQGTLGLELLEELPDLDAIVVGVGGGGLVTGIAAAVKAIRPAVRVIGVEPEGAACLTAALRENRVVPLDRVETIADGLAAATAGENVLEIARTLVDDVVLVSDEEIARGLAFLLERGKLLVEPAGAAGIAAILAGKLHLPAGSRVVTVASGGNIDLTRLREILPH